MKIGFYLNGTSEDGYRLARYFVKQARRVMPGVEICHLTDLESRAVPGVTVIRKAPQKSFTATLADAYALEGDWLFADTDAVIQQSVDDLFRDATWQIGLASRAGTFVDMTEEKSVFMQRMPFNTGIVYSRCPEFWHEVRHRILLLAPKDQQWYGMQLIVADVVDEGHYAVRILPNAFNYPPRFPTDDLSEKFVVHYKGPRKKWLLQRIAEAGA